MVESHENQFNRRHRLSRPAEPPEPRHARLQLSVPPFKTSSGWAYPYLMLRNDGPASAVDVSLSFHPVDQSINDPSRQGDSAPAGKRTPPTCVDGEPRVATLGQGEVVSFGISPPWGEPVRWSVELRWTDEAGSHIDQRQVSRDAPD